MATLGSDAHLKQTAQCCMPFVAKVVVTKLRSLREEMDYMEVYWQRSAPETHFETDGAALCAVCFKSLRDEAPVASWGNGLYGYILATQRSRLTFWDRRRRTACRLFQKSLWRSSRRFVEKWVVWMDTGDAALNMHILKPTAWRCVPCVSKSSWRISRRFVDEVTHISRSDGIVKVLKLMAIWLIWGIAVCFKTAST